jgi:hypothetical protein
MHAEKIFSFRVNTLFQRSAWIQQTMKLSLYMWIICGLVLNHLNYYQQLGTLKYCTTEGVIDNHCINFLSYDNIYHFELRSYLEGKEN